MSTRSIIARPLNDVGWTGNYHHNDGYPAGVGKTLWAAYHGHFAGDLAAMLAYLIDDHPGGWSSLVEADLSRPPGYREHGHCPSPSDDPEGFRDFFSYPRCFCHGDRNETDTGHREHIGPAVGDDWDIEWVYVLHPYGMDVLAALDHEFRHMAYVPWAGPEPDWESLGEQRWADAA
jgi:hypothetical protein